ISAGRERQQARNVLVVVQVALALVLLISSGLMVRTFEALRQVQPGFTRPKEVLTLRVSIPGAQVKETERAFRMQQDILNKIKNVPGVRTAAMASGVPMGGNTSADVLSIEDHPLAEGKMPPIRRFRFIAPGYFQTMGRRFVAGRDLTWADIDGFRPAVLISENLARAYWRTPAAALGKRVREGMNDDWREIIGVVSDEYDEGVQTNPPTVVYWPLLMKNFWGEKAFLSRAVTFVVRSPRTGSSAFLNEIQQAVWSVNPNVPLAEVRTLEEIYSKSMARTSFTLVMLAIAGGMALLLGVVGLYGVMAYSVSQRRREMGIRIALGAQREQVLNMVVRGGFQLAAVGVGIGIVAALGSTRYLASLLYGVKPTDPLTFAAVSLLLIAVALLASYLPARQAAKIDPMVALRHE
ncbi:MAG: FtsX-like permease family protein, partial [Acidobacteriaceae bacterium]|nr:FtsX-like permease family protein [Acidobacteriaceae bacterium]